MPGNLPPPGGEDDRPEEERLPEGLPAACGQLRDELVELALGVLEGRRRAEVLAHAERCAGCARELEEHTRTLDSVLEAAPAVEPPIGFEARLMERLDSDRRNDTAFRPARPAHRRLLAAAVVASLLAGGGAGAAVVATTGAATGPPARPPASRPLVAALSEAGAARGDVLVTAGQPAWMTVVLVDREWSGWVTCQVTTSRGQVVSVGGFELASGQGAWTAPLKVPASQLRDARIVTDGGYVLAEARFTS